MKTTEIEIKVRVEHVKPLLEFLAQQGVYQGEVQQVDEYFTPAHRDFLAVRPTAEWLRLRDAEGAFSITYKKWHFDTEGHGQYCDEYESNIESAKSVRLILEALDMKSLAIVNKHRRTWHYRDYEIAVDAVQNLGDFVEIEYIGNDPDLEPKAITDGMVALLKNQECGKIERNYSGYPFLLMFPDEAKWEEV